MKKLFVFILYATFLFSCKKNGKLEQEIERHISKVCKNSDCVIDLSKVTSFKWSKFYVFKETASLETIEKAINQNYPYFTDIARRLIFLDENNNIVYHEDVFPNVEGVTHKEVIFFIPDSLNFSTYISANFTVTKEKLEKGHYYLLNQKYQ